MELSAVLARLDTEGYARLGRVLGDDGLPVQAGEVVVLHNQLWHRSPHVNNQRRLMDLDNYVCSSQSIGDTSYMSLMGFHRPFGDRPFSERETSLVRVFHEELGRLWSGTREALPSRSLTPRLRDTLRHLLAGMTEKEIADVLNLSRQTVHDYVKALYRRYGVGSRSQLHVARAQEQEALRRRPALISDALCK
jgi:DNA-binding CsgD family transcriptional regulator